MISPDLVELILITGSPKNNHALAAIIRTASIARHHS